MKDSLKIKYRDGFIYLNPDYEWSPSNESVVLHAKIADIIRIAVRRDYSPADGYFDAYLAYKVIERIGGKLELPKRPEQEKEVVY